MNIRKIQQQKIYFSSEWDLVEIDKFARNCGITDTKDPAQAAALTRIITDVNITKRLYRGNLVLGISQKVITDMHNFGCRLQVVMKDLSGNLYCIEDTLFRVDDKITLAEFIYGTEIDKAVYMTESGVQSRFRGVYEESEKITKEYYAAGWEAHSIKIKANCLTKLNAKNRNYDLLTFLLSGDKNGMQNDAFFDVSYCKNVA